jgi:hypothetical protein
MLLLLISLLPALIVVIYIVMDELFKKRSEHIMKLEALVVCVDYSDFLTWTLPNNKQYFDNMVVVTTSRDIRTQKLCEFWHVKCVISDSCYADGAEFNKGNMINAGLLALAGDGWVVHLDADVWLPTRFREIVTGLNLDPDGLYTADRLMCTSFMDWLRFLYTPRVQFENNIFVHAGPFPLGTRVARMSQEYGGWIPIGFFQMWNQGKLKLVYPCNHADAARTDVLFTKQFDRANRHMLSELFVIHLEAAAQQKMGTNWEGRKAPLFGADVLGDDFFKNESLPPYYLPAK